MLTVLTSVSAKRCFSFGTITCFALVVFLSLGVYGVAFAQDTASKQRLEYSVAVSGDYAVVGAQWDDGSRNRSMYIGVMGTRWWKSRNSYQAIWGRHDHFGSSVFCGSVETFWLLVRHGTNCLEAPCIFLSAMGMSGLETGKLMASDAG